VDALLAEIPSRLFSEWMAYANLEPFGAHFQDAHFATLEAQLYNNGRTKKGQKAAKVEDYRLHKAIKKLTGLEFFNAFKASLKFGGHLKADD
jgi:hypothetical protein